MPKNVNSIWVIVPTYIRVYVKKKLINESLDVFVISYKDNM